MGAISKIRTVLKWILGIFLCLFIGFFYAFVPWFLTGIVTTSHFHFPDPNDKKTPKDFGMEFRPVEFHSTDGILLKGWYMPAGAAAGAAGGEARGTIIYCHGQNRTRVEMLPEAAFGHTLGFNGLVFDLRHQGQSSGTVSTVGYQERHDVVGAIHYVLNEEKAIRPVIIWGVSMGAAAALMGAAESPDASAVISDSAFPNYQELIRHHYVLFLGLIRRNWWWFPALPSFPLADEVMYWSAWRGHFKPADFDLEEAVRRINPRPVLFIAVEGDQRMPPSYARTLDADSTSPEKALVVVGGSRHGEAFKFANKQYEQAVTQFLGKVTGNGNAAASATDRH